jgi:hypothetical protein
MRTVSDVVELAKKGEPASSIDESDEDDMGANCKDLMGEEVEVAESHEENMGKNYEGEIEEEEKEGQDASSYTSNEKEVSIHDISLKCVSNTKVDANKCLLKMTEQSTGSLP